VNKDEYVSIVYIRLNFWRFYADEFNIYTREAGGGVLSVAVEGPSQAKVEVAENPNGYTMVSYTVTKEGLPDQHDAVLKLWDVQ